MFPITQLEDAFNDYLRSKLDPDVITPVSELASAWLLNFKGSENPSRAAIADMVQNGYQLNAKRLCFALSLVCCTPTAETGNILRIFKAYLNENATLIGSWVGEFSTDIKQTHPVDVIKAFSCLSDNRLYKLVCAIYQVDMESVRLAALANDDLKVFVNTLPTDPAKKLVAQFEALVKFPIDPESVIYKTLIQSRNDKANLAFFRLDGLRNKLSEEFSSGLSYLRPDGSAPITLLPGGVLSLPSPLGAHHASFHQEPDFQASIQADANNLVELFFRHRGGMLNIHPANWERVDEITRAFLGAGISAEQIVHQAAKMNFGVRVDLQQALTRLGSFDQQNQRFYRVAYQVFLERFDTQEIVASCINDKTLLAVYQVTENREFLQAGNGRVRESAMASDLGL